MIGLDSGSASFFGRSSATIPLIRHPSKPPPFRVVYGRDPTMLRAYVVGEARLPAVKQQMPKRDEFIAKIRDQLDQA